MLLGYDRIVVGHLLALNIIIIAHRRANCQIENFLRSLLLPRANIV